MGDYAECHLYWSCGALLYFGAGALLCTLILSVEWSAASYNGLLIGYTLLGLLLIAIWLYCHAQDCPGLLQSTLLAVPPSQDREYGVVQVLSVNAAGMSVLVVLLFWLWFLIYLRAVKGQSLQAVNEVYAVVFLPFTFFILLFHLASWWIPAGARRVCTEKYIHLRRPHHSHHPPDVLHW